MARDIPRMDWNAPAGMAGVQPYVALSCGSKTAKTRRKASRDPQWRQEIGISLMLPPGAHGAPPVRFQLYDHNFTASDRPIAAFRVPFRVRAAPYPRVPVRCSACALYPSRTTASPPFHSP